MSNFAARFSSPVVMKPVRQWMQLAFVVVVLTGVEARIAHAATLAPEPLRLVPIGRVASLPVTDGVRLLWERSPGVVGILRPGRAGRRHMELGPGCELADATTAGLALVGCGLAPAGTTPGYLIRTADRARIPLPANAVPSGRESVWADGIGRHWIRLLIAYPCGADPSRCGGSTRYVNWRTGEALTVEDDTDSDYDLDRRRLSPESPPDSLQSTDASGRLMIEHVSPLRDSRVVLERRGERHVIGRCAGFCSSLALRGRRAAWISARSGALHVRDLRSGRSWKGIVADGPFQARVWAAGDELVVAVWPGDEGPVPLYRVAFGRKGSRV